MAPMSPLMTRIAPRLLDAVTAAAILAVAVAVWVPLTDPFPYGIVVMIIALGWRTRWPTTVCAAVAVGAVLTFPRPIANGLLLILVGVLVVACYSAAVYAPFPWLGPTLLALTVAPWARTSRLPVPAVAIPFLILGSAWFAGVAVRTRAVRLESWRAAAERAVADRDAAYATAVRNERSRIARELHDIVTHRVSVMVIAAGAARLSLPGDPARAIDQLHTVESGGREALGELRAVLSLLVTSADESVETHPQPGLAAVPDLIDGVSKAGLPVAYVVGGLARSLPVGLDLAVYRIIQEALTNSLRHSDGAGTRVSVTLTSRTLTIDIADTSPMPMMPNKAIGGGHGLIGISERAAFYGGAVTVTDRPGSPFALEVHLMIPVDDVVALR